jgi:hypothetical protein
MGYGCREFFYFLLRIPTLFAFTWLMEALFVCMKSKCVCVPVDPLIVEHICVLVKLSVHPWLFSMMETTRQDDLTRMFVTMWAI